MSYPLQSVCDIPCKIPIGISSGIGDVKKIKTPRILCLCATNRSTAYLNDLEIIKRDYYFAMVTTMRGGYCGALQRTPPPLPAALNRRLANRAAANGANMGKVKTYSFCSRTQ